MTLVVLLRGINVGGHRRLRPAELARRLRRFDVVNVGTAGTLVVRKPGTRARLLAALRRQLPFDAVVAVCAAGDILRLVRANPFAEVRAHRDRVQFVSVLSQASRTRKQVPFTVPAHGPWFVCARFAQGRFICGEYRRHMKTIGYLGQLDALLGAPVTTRSWKTIVAIAAVVNRKARAATTPAPRAGWGRSSSRRS